MKKTAVCLLLSLALSLGLVAHSYATTITLADLVNDPTATILVGDKLFSNFTATFTPQGSNTSPQDMSGIVVTPVTLGNNFGLEFQGGLYAGVNSNVDLKLSYNVTVQNPTFVISDIHLIFNGAVTGAGFTSVVETVFTSDGLTGVGQAQVQNPPPVFDANIDIVPPLNAVKVSKDIFLIGSSNPNIPGTATISFTDQVFSQQYPGGEVPEPSTLLLLGSGLLGAGIRFRGKKA
jgi:hypothetical protein